MDGVNNISELMAKIEEWQQAQGNAEKQPHEWLDQLNEEDKQQALTLLYRCSAFQKSLIWNPTTSKVAINTAQTDPYFYAKVIGSSIDPSSIEPRTINIKKLNERGAENSQPESITIRKRTSYTSDEIEHKDAADNNNKYWLIEDNQIVKNLIIEHSDINNQYTITAPSGFNNDLDLLYSQYKYKNIPLEFAINSNDYPEIIRQIENGNSFTDEQVIRIAQLSYIDPSSHEKKLFSAHLTALNISSSLNLSVNFLREPTIY